MPGNLGNQAIHPKLLISVIDPQEGVPLALPKMKRVIDSEKLSAREVLNTGNTDKGHLVGTGG